MTLKEALSKIGDDIVTDAKSTLKSKNKIATGDLYNSVKYTVQGSELTFQMSTYAKYVDAGRKAGKWAPVDSIKAWCKVKGIDTSLAYVINRSIKENGIKPTYFFTTPFSKYTANLDDVLDKYIDDQIEDILNIL